jgi:hypothetical protein
LETKDTVLRAQLIDIARTYERLARQIETLKLSPPASQ